MTGTCDPGSAKVGPISRKRALRLVSTATSYGRSNVSSTSGHTTAQKPPKPPHNVDVGDGGGRGDYRHRMMSEASAYGRALAVVLGCPYKADL